MRASVSSILPKITFCWLPPESVPASCSGVPALIFSVAIISSTSALSRFGSVMPKRVKRWMTESVRFSRTLFDSSRP